MDALTQLLRKIGDVAVFSGIEITDANTRGLFNNHPLHVAAVWGDCDAIQLLIDSGARIDQSGEHGFTPLMEAVAQNHREATALLISLGAEPLRNNDGELPSEHARLCGHVDLANVLAERGF